jgi:hypothetical protein
VFRKAEKTTATPGALRPAHVPHRSGPRSRQIALKLLRQIIPKVTANATEFIALVPPRGVTLRFDPSP